MLLVQEFLKRHSLNHLKKKKANTRQCLSLQQKKKKKIPRYCGLSLADGKSVFLWQFFFVVIIIFKSSSFSFSHCFN